jgi:hypothetical protein
VFRTVSSATCRTPGCRLQPALSQQALHDLETKAPHTPRVTFSRCPYFALVTPATPRGHTSTWSPKAPNIQNVSNPSP